MGSPQPTIDILLATYNGEKYLREQIESIRYQTYDNWRLLISDDCSSDNTLDIIKNYVEMDSRIALISESRHFGSAKENFFHLLQHSTGSLVMFCDQDDVWLDDKIEVSLKEMEHAGGTEDSSLPTVVFTDSIVVDEDLQVLSYSYHKYANRHPYCCEYKRLLITNTAAGNTMMLNLPLVRLLQDVKHPSAVCMHDWFAMLVASAFGKIVYTPIPTVLYRQHGSNAVGAVKSTLSSKVLHRLNSKKDAEKVNRLNEESKAAAQAAFFAETYATLLSDKLYTETMEYVKAINADRLSPAVASLIKSGCWKPGLLPKIGQILHRYEYCKEIAAHRR